MVDKTFNLNKNRVGLILGTFFALIHALWAISIAIIPVTLQNFLNWIFKVHFLNPIWVITAFNFVDAILLVIITFICGYVFGWIFAAVWNTLKK